MAGFICAMYRARRSSISSTGIGQHPADDMPHPRPRAASTASKASSLPHRPQIGIDRHSVIRDPAGYSGRVGNGPSQRGQMPCSML
jgi:ribosomal protein L34E